MPANNNGILCMKMQPSHRQAPHSRLHTACTCILYIQFTNEVSWQTSTHTVCANSINPHHHELKLLHFRSQNFIQCMQCHPMPYHAVPYVCCIALHECVLQKMLCASHVDVVLLRFVLFRVNFAFISTCKKWNIILWAKNLYSRNGFCELFLFHSVCVSNVRANAKMHEFKFHQPKMLSKKCRLPQNVCNIFIFATSNGVFAAYSFAKVSFGKVWTNETGCNCVTSQAVYRWTKYHRLLESRGFI